MSLHDDKVASYRKKTDKRSEYRFGATPKVKKHEFDRADRSCISVGCYALNALTK